MDETHSSYLLNFTSEGNFPITSFFHAITRYCSTADSSTWADINVSEEPNNEVTVLDLEQNSPDASVRAIISHDGFSHLTAHWILHTKDMHSYHPDMLPIAIYRSFFLILWY
ncbi:hypothetical protein TNCV_948141 [Trichonephila clavipes]|nr:hypothetical protein TNCV_948141 [Trichonephila clavipes]